jgi:predicted dinucleotide-binding enzyme
MKVGVLGSGDVAKALADGFLKHGHSVMMGTRDASKLESWAAQKGELQIGSLAEAAAFADLVILAVKGTVALDALRLASAAAADQQRRAVTRVFAGRSEISFVSRREGVAITQDVIRA